jgi:tetratricopeptide (TPR) repeat protein
MFPHPWLLTIALTLAGPEAAQVPPDKQIEAAWQALQAGDGNAAEAAFKDALQQRPRDAMLIFGAGAAAHLLGRDAEAVDQLRRALQLEPALVPAAGLLGELEYRQGDLEAAIHTYESALQFATGDQAAALRRRLEVWRKDAEVHATLTDRTEARFSIVFDGQTENMLANHTLAVLDRAFDHISERLGAHPTSRILITLLSEQQFQDITRVPAWATGAFDGRIRVPIRGVAQDMERYDRILVHELTHAIVFQMAPRGVPAWLQEGLASSFEGRDPGAAQRRIQRANTVLPFSAMQDSFARFDANLAVLAYDESLVAADALVRMLGPRTGLLLQSLGRGQSFDESLGQLGVQGSEFESQVLRRLRP